MFLNYKCNNFGPQGRTLVAWMTGSVGGTQCRPYGTCSIWKGTLVLVSSQERGCCFERVSDDEAMKFTRFNRFITWPFHLNLEDHSLHRVLQGAPPKGRQLYFTFQVLRTFIIQSVKSTLSYLKSCHPVGGTAWSTAWSLILTLSNSHLFNVQFHDSLNMKAWWHPHFCWKKTQEIPLGQQTLHTSNNWWESIWYNAM